MIELLNHYNHVYLAVGKLDHQLVIRTRDYLDTKGKFVLREGTGDFTEIPKIVIAGKSDYSICYDVYHLPEINSVAVLKQYWQKKNPERFPALTCSIHGINKILNDLFLENLILSVVDNDKDKSVLLEKLRSP
ncbi:MAG: hypothetical protein Q8R37_03045 [Nanoarchaeota archaeon]|nr:hypothetical protein [Nanoarchaeota archaeon]